MYLKKFCFQTIDDCTNREKLGAYYWRIDDQETWDNAKSGCRRIPGADLISIHNFDELEVARSLWNNRRKNRWVWAGLQCPQPSANCQLDEYRWTDGTPIDYKIPWLATQQCYNSKIEYTNSLPEFFSKLAWANNPQTIQAKAILVEHNPSDHGNADHRIFGVCPHPGDLKDMSTLCKLKY